VATRAARDLARRDRLLDLTARGHVNTAQALDARADAGAMATRGRLQ
jgi:hypothetical protein